MLGSYFLLMSFVGKKLEKHKSTSCVYNGNFYSALRFSSDIYLAMNIIKTNNMMGDEFLTDFFLIHIEKKIAEKISTYSIIYNFHDMQKRELCFDKSIIYTF